MINKAGGVLWQKMRSKPRLVNSHFHEWNFTVFLCLASSMTFAPCCVLHFIPACLDTRSLSLCLNSSQGSFLLSRAVSNQVWLWGSQICLLENKTQHLPGHFISSNLWCSWPNAVFGRREDIVYHARPLFVYIDIREWFFNMQILRSTPTKSKSELCLQSQHLGSRAGG